MKAEFPPLVWLDSTTTFVIGQLGQSLDGRIAMPNGESRGINGAASLDHLHELRARVDAVLVGVNTVVADDPALNVRRAQGRHPARVVIDPNGRMQATANCIQGGDGAPCLVIGSNPSPTIALPSHVERIFIERQNNVIAPHLIMEALHQRGYKKLLVEGGAATLATFIDHNCLDRLHILLSPIILGAGQSGLNPRPAARLTLSLRPKTQFYPLGSGDLLLDCDFRQSAT